MGEPERALQQSPPAVLDAADHCASDSLLGRLVLLADAARALPRSYDIWGRGRRL
ncbi:hypothetical protein D3C81_2097820 [compost metagenome]